MIPSFLCLNTMCNLFILRTAGQWRRAVYRLVDVFEENSAHIFRVELLLRKFAANLPDITVSQPTRAQYESSHQSYEYICRAGFEGKRTEWSTLGLRRTEIESIDFIGAFVSLKITKSQLAFLVITNKKQCYNIVILLLIEDSMF